MFCAELMKLIENQVENWGEEYDAWQILGDIENFPAADVAPVVRGEWIKVEDRLPEKWKAVLTITVVGSVFVNVLFLDDCGSWCGRDGYPEIVDPVYWMPLPELPKEVFNNGN